MEKDLEIKKEKFIVKTIKIILFLLIVVQSFGETVVKGTYESKRKRYVELSQTFVKEINLNYVLPTNKKEVVIYYINDYEISMNKNDLLELYNKGKAEPLKNIKNKISYKDKKFIFIENDIAELIENNKAVVYDKRNKREIDYLIKVKYGNAIYYDSGGGSYYDGYSFYTDKEWTKRVLNFDIITKFGIAIHRSLGNKLYNRELKNKEKIKKIR